MTDKELQQLAREYAEQNPPQGLKDEVLKRALIEKNAEIFEKFLVWLTKTHCIVSREKVKELCRLAIDNSMSVDYGLIDGLTDMGDMFNEEYRNEIENE